MLLVFVWDVDDASGRFDEQLLGARYIAGNRFSTADIVVYSGIELAAVWRCAPRPSLGGLSRWKAEIDQHPSAELARYIPPDRA